jgi:general stress protein CsbA
MVDIALNPPQQKVDRFYVGMALTCVLIAFGGFAPTYWLQLVPGTFVGTPLLHIHGLLFSAWPVLLLTQAMFVANGRRDLHRALGLAGISLATAMVFVGLTAAIQTLDAGLAAGYGDRSRAFLILPVSAISLFAGFLIAAIANIRRPEVHKRLMLLATISLLQAAMGRVFFILVTGGGPGLRPGLGEPPPLIIGLAPSLILELLIVAGVVHDWRTRGRPHPVWLIGAAIMTTVIVLRGPLGETAAWSAVANVFAHISG